MTPAERRQRILDVLSTNPGITNERLLEKVKGKDAHFRRALLDLSQEGAVKREIDSGRYRWYLADSFSLAEAIRTTVIEEPLSNTPGACCPPPPSGGPGGVAFSSLDRNGRLDPSVKSVGIDKTAIPYYPASPIGPSNYPHIPEGHELSGVSSCSDGSGNIEHQWNKTRIAGTEPVRLPPGFDLPDRVSRMARGDGSVVVEWRKYNKNEAERSKALIEAIRAHVEEHVRPLDPLDAPTDCDNDLLTAYCLGDPHIGMLAWAEEVGENFDVSIAIRDLIQCLRNLVSRAPASRNALVVNLGDFFHSQDDKQVTPTSGNKLDVDGRFARTARIGIDMFVSLIECALQKHEHVTVRNLPGNHDIGACFWISETLRREFKNEPRVTVSDAFNPYQYDQFGKTMLMWAHTDGAKLEQLAEIAAADRPVMWGTTCFRYAHGGHIHSLKVVERPGMVGESHRTLAGKDAWHNRNGYRSGRSLQAITYHREWGEVSRVIEGIERVRGFSL